jgi:hypothetical protein
MTSFAVWSIPCGTAWQKEAMTSEAVQEQSWIYLVSCRGWTMLMTGAMISHQSVMSVMNESDATG